MSLEKDFLNFKNYEVNVKAETSMDSGGWEVTFDQGDGATTITWIQLKQIYTQLSAYIEA